MRGKVAWYPNADENKCSGSFRFTSRLSGRDSSGKRKGQCPVCSRWVGLRNDRHGQLAQHRKPSPLKALIGSLEPRRNVTVQGTQPDVLLTADYSGIESRLCAAAAAGIPLPSPSTSGSPTGRVSAGEAEIQEWPTRRWAGQGRMYPAENWLRQARAAERFAERVQAAAIRHHAVAMVHDEMEFTNERDANAFWRELRLLTDIENFEVWQAEAGREAVDRANAFRAAQGAAK